MEAQEKGNVSLREYLDMRIDSVRVSVDQLEKNVSAKDVLDEKALKLQFNEYERRMEALNNEAQRLSKMVTSEMFETTKAQLHKEIDKSVDYINEIKLWISNTEGKNARAQWIAIISLLVSAVAVIWNIYSKK